jgi:regulatory protein
VERDEQGAEDPEPAVDPERVARTIALRQLAVQPRSRAELERALRRRGVAEDVIERVLGRFSEVGLIDDAAFARAWVESRHAGKGLARRALAHELRRRGVEEDHVDAALDELTPEQELETAQALVRRRLRVLHGVDSRTRIRRLVAMLARKGYPAGLALRAVRDVLSEETAQSGDLSQDGVDELTALEEFAYDQSPEASEANA